MTAESNPCADRYLNYICDGCESPFGGGRGLVACPGCGTEHEPGEVWPPASRWAAFTDEELFFLHGAMDEDLGITSLTDSDYPDIRLRDEMAAEIERRKERCLATDGADVTCTLPLGHEGWHQDIRDGEMWAGWRVDARDGGRRDQALADERRKGRE